jgi:dTMP kinase
MTPKYIAFEGIDGSGKDTQLARLTRRLEREGITPIILHEPSFGVHGRRIRAGLTSIPEDIEEQRALFMRTGWTTWPPRLPRRLGSSGPIPDSSSCRTGQSSRPPPISLAEQATTACSKTIEAELRIAPMPDAIVVLDLPVEIALSRIATEGSPDAMEHPDRLAAARVRYQRLCELLPACRLIEAADDGVATRVYNALT